MVDVTKYYESASKTLKASDLPPGKEIPVIIDSIEEHEFDDEGKNGKVRKLVLKFKGKEKGLVLNKTNATVIASAHGPDSDRWPGKKIYIYATKVQFGDSMVDAIRVRAELEVAAEEELEKFFR